MLFTACGLVAVSKKKKLYLTLQYIPRELSTDRDVEIGFDVIYKLETKGSLHIPDTSHNKLYF